MRSVFQILALVALLVSGSSSAQEIDSEIQRALDLQSRVIDDPFFWEVLRELEQADGIAWRESNLKPHQRNGGAENAHDVEWIFKNVERYGLAKMSDIKPVDGRFWGTDTFAKTKPCRDRIKVRRSAVSGRDDLSLVNTLVHERVHSFCLLHKGISQRRIHNMCDISYVAGDLAEATLARSSAQTERKFADTSVCPALCSALEVRGMNMCQSQDYTIINVFRHDSRAFTQGLLFHQGFLFESTGRSGSDVRKVKLKDGSVLNSARIGSRYFGEGLSIWSDSLISLTWEAGEGFIWDPSSLERLGAFRFSGTRQGEGWGFTSDGQSLIMSDGSSVLSYFDPSQFQDGAQVEPIRQLNVALEGQPLCHLNELEFADGHIYANVWQSKIIVRIDPQDGNVNGVVDLTDIVDNVAPDDSAAVLNGIAHVDGTDRFFVTGKYWNSLFELRLRPRLVGDNGDVLQLKTPLIDNNFCDRIR